MTNNPSVTHDEELTCIVCPVGCTLKVSVTESGIRVVGNRCSRGAEYGLKEVTHPERHVQSTVVLEGSIKERRLPVKTDGPVPKERVFDVVHEIRKVKVHVPVKRGDAIIENVLGLGINVVASRSVDE